MRALLRRHGQDQDAAPTFQFGDVHVDLSRRIVCRGGIEVHLTKMEYRLLAVMLATSGGIITGYRLLQAVWGTGIPSKRTICVFIWQVAAETLRSIQPSRNFFLPKPVLVTAFNPESLFSNPESTVSHHESNKRLAVLVLPHWVLPIYRHALVRNKGSVR